MGIAILAIIGVAIYVILKKDGGFRDVGIRKDDPVEVLKKRLAAGEIDEEEYTRLLKLISN